MFRFIDRSLADDHVRLPIENRLYELLNIIATVLVVRIRIDDDVRAVTKAPVQTSHKAFCKTFVLFEIHDMVHTPFFRHRHGIVLTAVVDDQIFDLVNPLYLFWQGIQRNL